MLSIELTTFPKTHLWSLWEILIQPNCSSLSWEISVPGKRQKCLRTFPNPIAVLLLGALCAQKRVEIILLLLFLNFLRVIQIVKLCISRSDILPSANRASYTKD